MKTKLIPAVGTFKESEYPILNGKLKKVDSNEKEREELIIYGLKNFSHLIDLHCVFRLSYLAQKIKKYYSDEKAIFIADLMIVNSSYYSPYQKTPYGIIQP